LPGSLTKPLSNYPELPQMQLLVDSADQGVAFVSKDYDRFLQLAEKGLGHTADTENHSRTNHRGVDLPGRHRARDGSSLFLQAV
jgi:hypothetical protein